MVMADLLCKQLIISRAGIFRGVGCGRWGTRTIFTARPRCRNNDSMTWRKYYKDLIGIAEIRNANDKVNQKAENFLRSLQSTHNQESKLSAVWSKLHSTRYYAMCSSTVRRFYSPTLENELSLLKQEQQAQRVLRECNAQEIRKFQNLQSELYQNILNERRRHYKRLGWIAIACIVGSGIGISGAYLSHYLWYYFFRDEEDEIVTQVTPIDTTNLRLLATRLSDSMQARSKDFLLYLGGLHSALRDIKLPTKLTLPPPTNVVVPSSVKLADQEDELFPVLTGDVLSRINNQHADMKRIIKELKYMINLQLPSVPKVPSVVIVEPKEEEPVNEANIWKTTFVYAVILLLIPVALGESLM